MSCLYVALSVPGAWFPSAAPKTLAARDFTLTRGNGARLDRRRAALDHGRRRIGLGARDRQRPISGPATIRSSRGTGIDFPERADVRFLWRTDYAPGKINSMPVTIAAGRLTPVVMSEESGLGRPHHRCRARRARTRSPSRCASPAGRRSPAASSGQLTDRVREWLTFERWSGTSINTSPAAPMCRNCRCPRCSSSPCSCSPPAAWFALAGRRHRTDGAPRSCSRCCSSPPGSLLDAQWMWNLVRQVGETRAHVRRQGLARAASGGRGRSAVPVHREGARRKCPRRRRACSWLADASYFRGRAAYHLYPHNVLFRSARQRRCRPLRRCARATTSSSTTGAEFNTTRRESACASRVAAPVSAEALLVEPGAACSGPLEASMDLLALAASALLPWLLGIAVLTLLACARSARPPTPGEIAWIARRGLPRWRVSALTLWMRALSLAGIKFGVLVIALAAARHDGRVLRPAHGGAMVTRWRTALREAASRCPVAAPRRARCLVAAARVARRALRAARRRGHVAAALSVGRVDAMGDQGPRLVRAGLPRPLRARGRVVRRQRRRLLRRVARVSADRCRCCRSGLAWRSAAGTTC